ncbi:MAG: hypothetical protein WAT12_08655 [Candidatus Nitrotoga sp.]
MARYLHTIYCDDVRLEVGNKQSLMGIYSGDLLVSEFPVALPKLCIIVNLVTSIDKPLKELTIKVTKDNETLIEVPVTSEKLSEPQSSIVQNGDMNNTDRRIALNFTLTIAPFTIEKECILRVRAVTESGELKGNALKIKSGQLPQA